MNYISIIGAGQIGSRHLQALKNLNIECVVQVIDPHDSSLKTAKQRYDEITVLNNNVRVEYNNNISSLSKVIDVAIISTSSNVRREIIEKLLSNKNIKNIILEKVLFQKIEDFTVVEKLLYNKKVKSWVNCPCRMWPFYKNLKSLLKGTNTLELSINGSNWGLGCNSIHMIDLLSFLTGESEYQLYTEQLDMETIPSKRPGFIEFTGGLFGKFINNSKFSIYSYKSGNLPALVQIHNDSVRCIIRESEGKAWVSTKANNWKWKEELFEIPYQSQLTNLVVEKIIKNGSCDLTPFNESLKLHIPLIEGLINHLKRNNPEGNITICPIT